MKRKKNKGFTLVELLVVIAIIGILAAVVAPNAFRAVEKSKIAAVVADLKAIKAAALAYYADTGAFPPCDDVYSGSTSTYRGIDFLENHSNITGWNGPYLENWPKGTYWNNSHGGTFQWQGQYETSYNTSTHVATYNPSIYFGSGPRSDGKSDVTIELNFGDSGLSNADIGKIVQRVDDMLDDGNLSTGDFRCISTLPSHCAYYRVIN